MGAETVNEPLLAYNLTVEGFHTYFVAANEDAAPVWVHNDCGAQQLLNLGAVRINNTEIIGIDGRIYTKGANGSYVKGHVATADQIDSSGVDIDYSYFSTAHGNQYVFPTNLTEQYLFDDILANPSLGRGLNLSGDVRFPIAEGWQKMTRSLVEVDGTRTTIHYQWNTLTGDVVDLKFTP